MVVKSHPQVSFASAATPEGPFVFSKTVAPNGGGWAGDLTVFVDPASPADAYLIYSGGTASTVAVGEGAGKQGAREIVVAKLTDDWLDVVPDRVTHIPDNREGPAAFYAPGVGYFIWTSHTTGWNPYGFADGTPLSQPGVPPGLSALLPKPSRRHHCQRIVAFPPEAVLLMLHSRPLLSGTRPRCTTPSRSGARHRPGPR